MYYRETNNFLFEIHISEKQIKTINIKNMSVIRSLKAQGSQRKYIFFFR